MKRNRFDVLAIREIEKTLPASPVEQRVPLAASLLSLLPPADEARSEAEELAELERRERQIECGEIQPVPEVESRRRVSAVGGGEYDPGHRIGRDKDPLDVATRFRSLLFFLFFATPWPSFFANLPLLSGWTDHGIS